jgi:hypothetical protein
LQSGAIGNSQSSTISIHYDIENETDQIRFFRKTDCASGDFLKFYIDGVEKESWTGTLNWREVVIPVTQGEHTFTWSYEKNASGSSGADCAWIDEILFPLNHISFACNAGFDQDICQEPAQLEAMSFGYAALAWTTNGDGSFSQTDILDPIYTPGEQDLANKVVILTLTAIDETGNVLIDEVTITFHEAASIEMDDEADICEGQSFNLHATVNEADSYAWETNGDGNFDRPDYLETSYSPGIQDIANGQVTLTLKAFSSIGCGDAQHDLTLSIHPLQNTEFEAVSCGPFTWNGTLYDAEGDYTQILQSIHGCDSTVVMHLAMVDAYQVEVEEDACDSYVWFDETFNESGVYQKVFTSIHGCDSIVTMNLRIHDSYVIGSSGDGCESFEWDGITYTESGTYIIGEYQSIYGCDSICNLTVTITHAPVESDIEGVSEVDTRITPSSTYILNESAEETVCIWSIEPVEAGSINIGETSHSATVTWNEDFKGQATVIVHESNICGEVLNTLPVTVKNSTDVDEYDAKVNLYPNPTDGSVTIEAEDMRRLTVYDLLGQAIDDLELRADMTRLDLARFGSGTYILRIFTENGVIVRRVSVIR